MFARDFQPQLFAFMSAHRDRPEGDFRLNNLAFSNGALFIEQQIGLMGGGIGIKPAPRDTEQPIRPAKELGYCNSPKK